MSNVSDNISNISDDNVDDDVFEGVAITQKRLQDNLGKVNENYNEEMTMTMMIRPRGSRLCGDGAITKTVDISHRSNNNNTIIQTSTITTAATAATITTTTSSAASRSQSQTLSGYSSCRPSREALQLFALKDINYDRYDYDYDDGWRSYHYDEVGMISTPPPIIQPIHKKPFDDTVNHKTILLGDSGVGKTSFLVKYNTGEFRLGSFSATVGIALTNKVVIVDGTRVKLQIWDTAGQERFRSVTHAYYRDAHALLLMYDVTNKLTYDNIRAWLCEIRDCAQEDVVIVLIGNKADCSNNDRQVKREDGERLAREHNVPFMETSAKNGQNVELAFQTVARQLKNRGHEQNDEGKFNIHEFVRDNTKAKTMCAQCNL